MAPIQYKNIMIMQLKRIFQMLYKSVLKIVKNKIITYITEMYPMTQI